MTLASHLFHRSGTLLAYKTVRLEMGFPDLDYLYRVRLVPYAVGVVTFAQNLFDNLHDAICGSGTDPGAPATFAGKVGKTE